MNGASDFKTAAIQMTVTYLISGLCTMTKRGGRILEICLNKVFLFFEGIFFLVLLIFDLPLYALNSHLYLLKAYIAYGKPSLAPKCMPYS